VNEIKDPVDKLQCTTKWVVFGLALLSWIVVIAALIWGGPPEPPINLAIADPEIYRRLTEAVRTVRSNAAFGLMFSVGAVNIVCIITLLSSSRALAALHSTPFDEKHELYSIVDTMFRRQRRQFYRLLAITVPVILALCATNYWVFKSFPTTLVVFGLGLVVLLCTRYFAFRYRVNHGFYGGTVGEAREIVRFIYESAEKFDDTTGRGRRIRSPRSPKVTTTTEFGSVIAGNAARG
jgi:hypothetical protein